MSDKKDTHVKKDQVANDAPTIEPTSAPTSAPNEDPMVETPKTTNATDAKKSSAIIPEDYYGTIDDLSDTDSDYTLNLLPDHRDHVLKTIESIRPEQMPGSSQDIADYVESLEEAMKHSGFSTHKLSPFGREDSEWARNVEHEGRRIAATRPKMRSGTGNMNADQAVLRARAAAKLGTIVSIPLVHTGIWIDQKAPPDAELLDLERRILSEKQKLGRSTAGLTFSNAGIYVNSHLVNSALSYVYNTTFKSDSISALKEVIKVTDIPTIVWGYASAIWPDGYRLVRPCVTDPNTCTHRDTKLISIPKLFWMDRRALSTYQKNFLLDKNTSRNHVDLAEYQRQHVVPQTHQFDVGDGFAIRLSVPTIAKNETAGLRWINSVVDAVDGAFGEKMSTKERDAHIHRRGTMTSLRRYIHWIDALIYDGDTIVTDPNSIDDVMDSLSGAEQARTLILDEVERFISRCSISAIGIPAYSCPACGGEPSKDEMHPRLGDIIQLEVNEIFFTLERTRTRKTLAQM